MSRPVDWSPLAGSDPVPGDPQRVEQLGKHYRRVAEAINDAARKLRQVADHNDMQSDAVEAFRNTAREVADDISRAHERYDGVAHALAGYAPALRDAQSESVGALTDAKNAESDLAAANRMANSAHSRITTAPAGADTTVDQGAYRRAIGAADAAGDALAAARRRLERATDARDTAANRARNLIHEVRDSGDLNDSWWDNWGAKVVKAIVKVADIVAVVAGVLALAVSWIPIIGQALAAILGTIALVAALVSLLGNLALASTGYAEWSEVAWSALGVLAFGLGRVAMTGVRAAAKGVRGGSRLAAGRLAAKSPATRAAAGLPASSNPMTAIRSMVGTSNSMGRNAARDLAREAVAYRPTVSSIGQNLRAIPGEFRSNLQTLRNADWGEAMRQAPAALAEQGGSVVRGDFAEVGMRMFGEAGAADDLARINQLPQGIRASDDVAPHLSNLRTHTQDFIAAGGYSTFDIFRQTAGFVNSEPPPAESLKLPAASGGRP